MIEVVWVDDECLDDSGHLTHLGESICDAAYRRGININAFRDYEAAKAELRSFPYKKLCWSIRPAFFFGIHSDMESDISDLHTSGISGQPGYRFRIIPVQQTDL